MEFSQWVNDLLGILSMVLLWLPFVIGIITIMVLLIIDEVKVRKAQIDYYRALNEHDKNIIDEYNKCKRVWLFRGKRHIKFK